MKVEIKNRMLIFFPETIKEERRLKKFLKLNAAKVIIPKSRKQFCYWKVIDLWLSVNF